MRDTDSKTATNSLFVLLALNTLGALLITALANHAPTWTLPRAIIGILWAFYLPGYIVTKTIYPRSELNFIETVGLSLVFGLAATTTIGVFFCFQRILNLNTLIVASYILTALLSLITVFRNGGFRMPRKLSSISKSTNLFAVLLVIVVSHFLPLKDLFGVVFETDSAVEWYYSYSWVREGGFSSLQEGLHVAIDSPRLLYPAVNAVLMVLSGSTDIALMSPLQLLFSITTTLFVYMWSTKILRERKFSVIPVAVLSLTPIFIYHTFDMKENMLQTFLFLLVVYFLDKALQKNKTKDAMVAASFSGLLMFLKITSTVLVLMAVLILPIAIKKRRELRPLVYFCVLSIIPFAFAFGIRRVLYGFYLPTLSSSMVTFWIGVLPQIFFQVKDSIYVLSAPFLVLGLFEIFKRKRYVTVAYVAAFVFLYLVIPWKFARYIMPVLPVLCVYATALLYQINSSARQTFQSIPGGLKAIRFGQKRIRKLTCSMAIALTLMFNIIVYSGSIYQLQPLSEFSVYPLNMIPGAKDYKEFFLAAKSIVGGELVLAEPHFFTQAKAYGLNVIPIWGKEPMIARFFAWETDSVCPLLSVLKLRYLVFTWESFYDGYSYKLNNFYTKQYLGCNATYPSKMLKAWFLKVLLEHHSNSDPGLKSYVFQVVGYHYNVSLRGAPDVTGSTPFAGNGWSELDYLDGRPYRNATRYVVNGEFLFSDFVASIDSDYSEYELSIKYLDVSSDAPVNIFTRVAQSWPKVGQINLTGTNQQKTATFSIKHPSFFDVKTDLPLVQQYFVIGDIFQFPIFEIELYSIASTFS